jgi:phage protein D
VSGISMSVPRIWAQINGTTVDSVMHANISNNGSCKSSRFELTVSTIGNAADNQWLDLLSGKVAVTIYMSSRPDGSDLATFDGLADNVGVDMINGTARIIGRDYSSVLISSTYQSSYCNLTASEIATCIATRHGFAQNISQTSTMVGSYQCDGYNQVLLNAHSQITSEWDLLKYVARTEGFQLFVDGTTLIFAPTDALSRNALSIAADNVMALTFHKKCPTSGQTTLTAKSWNSWLGQALTFTDDQSNDQPAFDFPSLNADPGIEIAMVKPNLTPQSAEQLVSRRLDILNEEATTVQITMPGETSLMPGDLLNVASFLNTFNTDYIVKSVRRRFSTDTGFVQYVQGYAMPANSGIAAGTGT